MSNKKQLPFRQIHLDFHTSPFINDVGSDFNADEFAQTLSNAKVNGINLFAKCHHGYYYYESACGDRHPALKSDLLPLQVEACRKKGIAIGIYTCVAWSEHTGELHPQWYQIDRAGRLGACDPFDNSYVRWHNLCINNPAYKSHMKMELAEEIRLFYPDSFWIDIVSSNGCVCMICQNEMRKQGLEPSNPDHVRIHDRRSEIKFMSEFREYIKSFNEDIKIYFNGNSSEIDLDDVNELSHSRKRGTMDFVDIESLPSNIWGYTHFPINANALNYREKDITMMNGKFHFAWGDFGSLRNEKALEYECFRALQNGARSCIGDQMHPRGKLETEVYKRIGRVFDVIEKREGIYAGSKKVSEIGVYADNRVLEDPAKSIEGAYRILTERNYLFDIIDCETVLDRYRLLILPDCVKLNKKGLEKLAEFIKKDGKVIATARSCVSSGSFEIETGADYLGIAEFAPRYMQITRENFPSVVPMNYVFYNRGIKIKQHEDSVSLAEIINPYFNRDYLHFCSHRQTPDDRPADEAGIIQKKNIIYVSQPIFAEYAEYGNILCKEIITTLIKRLMPDNLVQADVPDYAEITLRENDSSLILSVLNYIIQRKCRTLDTIEESVPLYNREIRVRMPGKPKRITVLGLNDSADSVEIAFKYSEGCVVFKPEVISGFETFVIEK